MEKKDKVHDYLKSILHRLPIIQSMIKCFLNLLEKKYNYDKKNKLNKSKKFLEENFVYIFD